MNPGHKTKFLRTAFLILLLIWIINWAKNFYKISGSHYEDTRRVFAQPLEEKWKYLLGEDLYALVAAAKEKIPADEKAVFLHNLDTNRTKWSGYLLFPLQITSDARYIIVYKVIFNLEPGYRIIYSQAPDIFILKR